MPADLEPITWRQSDQWPVMVRATRPGRLLPPSESPAPRETRPPAGGAGSRARGNGPTPVPGPACLDVFDEDFAIYALAEEAERGYDLDRLTPGAVGREAVLRHRIGDLTARIDSYHLPWYSPEVGARHRLRDELAALRSRR